MTVLRRWKVANNLEQPPVNMKILELHGTPREQGRQHGESARDMIREIDSRWRDDITRDMNMHPEEYLSHLVEKSGFLRAVQKYTPELLEEVYGIAEGSGLDFISIFARQLCDEDWWLRFELKYEIGSSEHCSSIGIVTDGMTLIAQNMDTPSYWDGQQILLHLVNPDGLETFVYTIAGSIALCGMNNKGVGVCCNTILPCNHSIDGLPEQFVVRSLLREHSRLDAERFIRRVHHASAQNYLVGDRKGMIDLEVSANAICEYRPLPSIVYHSNHPLVNEDQSQYEKLLENLPDDMRDAMVSGSTTLSRFKFLERELSTLPVPPTLDKVKQLLRTAPVCVAKDDKRITLGSVIFEFVPDVRFLLASGPPDIFAYRQYAFLSS
jgi:isopenicillin-N N-acyltransferase like protein